MNKHNLPVSVKSSLIIHPLYKGGIWSHYFPHKAWLVFVYVTWVDAFSIISESNLNMSMFCFCHSSRFIIINIVERFG